LHLAGSGRTSIPVDREIDPARYRTAGYRVCGERAVRVDILERLADLIRPALAWREGSGPKPPGAVAGGGFTVINGMTSLTGASGEDFASILRSLGYRMERRPNPAEPPSAAPAPELTAAANGGAPQTELTADSASTSPTPPIVDQSEAVATSETPEAAPHVGTPVLAEKEAHESVLQPAPEFITATPPVAGQAVVSAVDAGAANAAAETAQARAADEPVLIEVWRPGRPEGRHGPRPRHRDTRGRGRQQAPASRRPEEPVAPIVPAGETASPPPAADTPAATTEVHARQGRPPRHRRRHAAEHRPDRSDRPPRERERPPVKRFERREKAPDPNSPFAKLAALKAQLEADAKERR